MDQGSGIQVDLILDPADIMNEVTVKYGSEAGHMMLRRALTYQLILTVVMGPLLCCCSAGRLLAGSPSASNTPATQNPRVPAERVSHSCCAHKHHPAKQEPGQKPAPSKPGKPTEKCPCKDESGQSQTTQAEPTQPDVSTFLRTLSLDSATPFNSLVPVEAPESAIGFAEGERCLDHSLLTTAELLYAHHNLRC